VALDCPEGQVALDCPEGQVALGFLVDREARLALDFLVDPADLDSPVGWRVIEALAEEALDFLVARAGLGCLLVAAQVEERPASSAVPLQAVRECPACQDREQAAPHRPIRLGRTIM